MAHTEKTPQSRKYEQKRFQFFTGLDDFRSNDSDRNRKKKKSFMATE